MSTLALALLVVSAASAQVQADASLLLQRVSDTARAARTFHAEGTSVLEMTGEGTLTRTETAFQLSTGGPRYLRWESTGAQSGLRVCDGNDAWIYFARAGFHTRNPVQPSHCDPPIPRWDNVADLLIAAEITGREQVDFNGRRGECQVIHAEYESGAQILTGFPNAGKTVMRTLCIDPLSSLIVRDRLDSNSVVINLRTVATFTYTKAEWNAALDAGTFEFQPPANSFLNPPARTPPAPDRVGVYPILKGMTAPILIYKTEPTYSEEARAAKFQGTVLLGVVVGADGVPRDLRVVRGLGMGLDEKAIEAVKQWRFRPGQKDGQPVASTVQIEVNFRLL